MNSPRWKANARRLKAVVKAPEPRHRQANIARIERKSGLEPSSALNQVNNQDDDRNYEQEMDQTAANVAKKAKKPEHDQDNNYSPEHGIPFG
jgi:hypothetical protein